MNLNQLIKNHQNPTYTFSIFISFQQLFFLFVSFCFVSPSTILLLNSFWRLKSWLTPTQAQLAYKFHSLWNRLSNSSNDGVKKSSEILHLFTSADTDHFCSSYPGHVSKLDEVFFSFWQQIFFVFLKLNRLFFSIIFLALIASPRGDTANKRKRARARAVGKSANFVSEKIKCQEESHTIARHFVDTRKETNGKQNLPVFR